MITPRRVFFSIIGLLFAGNLFVWYAVYKETSGKLEVDFLDVGQGDAIFIQTPNGNQILVDGGPPNGKVVKELSRIMPFYDRSIDMIILSHPHADHLGGLSEVLSRYKVTTVIDSGTDYKTAEHDAYEETILKNGVKHLLGLRGMKIISADGANFKIILPAINSPELGPHEGMLVSKLTYGGDSFLLTGDMEAPLEKYLLVLGENLKSDVLKVGHHGSKTSTSLEFLAAVNPKYAVISVGEGNKYGHPHQEVLDRLKNFGAQIFRTDKDSTVKTISDGQSISIF